MVTIKHCDENNETPRQTEPKINITSPIPTIRNIFQKYPEFFGELKQKPESFKCLAHLYLAKNLFRRCPVDIYYPPIKEEQQAKPSKWKALRNTMHFIRWSIDQHHLPSFNSHSSAFEEVSQSHTNHFNNHLIKSFIF